MSKKVFQVGQSVTFEMGDRTVQGVITENRGAIGRKGRILYRIEFPFEGLPMDRAYIELGAEDIKEVQNGQTSGK